MRYRFVRWRSIRSRIESVIRPSGLPSAFCPNGVCTRKTAMISMATSEHDDGHGLHLHFRVVAALPAGRRRSSLLMRPSDGRATVFRVNDPRLRFSTEANIVSRHRAVLGRTAAVLERVPQLDRARCRRCQAAASTPRVLIRTIRSSGARSRARSSRSCASSTRPACRSPSRRCRRERRRSRGSSASARSSARRASAEPPRRRYRVTEPRGVRGLVALRSPAGPSRSLHRAGRRAASASASRDRVAGADASSRAAPQARQKESDACPRKPQAGQNCCNIGFSLVPLGWRHLRRRRFQADVARVTAACDRSYGLVSSRQK